MCVTPKKVGKDTWLFDVVEGSLEKAFGPVAHFAEDDIELLFGHDAAAMVETLNGIEQGVEGLAVHLHAIEIDIGGVFGADHDDAWPVEGIVADGREPGALSGRREGGDSQEERQEPRGVAKGPRGVAKGPRGVAKGPRGVAKGPRGAVGKKGRKSHHLSVEFKTRKRISCCTIVT